MKKSRTHSRRTQSGKVTRLSASRPQSSPHARDQKLSEIIKDLALSVLKDPTAIPSAPAALAALTLASAAWNHAVGAVGLGELHRRAIQQIDWTGGTAWAELCSDDVDQLIADLVDAKQEHYPNDLRRIVATEMNPEGHVRVHWTDPQEVVTPAFRPRGRQAKSTQRKHGRPIAEKLVRKMKNHIGGPIINFQSIVAGHERAEQLQKTVATREDLAGLHPAHAVYMYALNQVSVMSEQLTALKEMWSFAKLISKAEEEYLPSGPPMSPLTPSFFTCWALFDACIGQATETIGTTVMALGAAFGMHDELLRVIGLMQKSRMGIYLHEGMRQGTVVLRELVTDTVSRAVVPSGYRGHKGELWYARVLPPPLPGMAQHVVFTTPYLLLAPDEPQWQAYFHRTLPDAPREDRIAEYTHHMKFGPTRDYWTEFVFEAYVNHFTEAILLAGLPDVPESRPHSRINGR